MHRFRLWMTLGLFLLIIGGGSAAAQDTSPVVGVTSGGYDDGYTLFTPQNSNHVYLIDGTGAIVHSWTVSDEGRDAFLRENGNLVVSVAMRDTEIEEYADHIAFIQIDGRFEEYTWDGELVWEYEFDRPGYEVHHGIEVLPNGNVMFIAWEYITREEAIAAGRDPETIGDGLWPDVILEYSPTEDAIVWEWRVWDHIIQDFDPDKPNYGVVADNPQLIDLNFFEPLRWIEDWQHANAIDYNPELDQIAFSVREFNELWIIDKSTTTEEAAGEAGNLLYRWGNPRSYDRGDLSDRWISYQHDVQWIPPGHPGEGNIILYSNRHSTNPDASVQEMHDNPDYSRIVELTPPLQPDGTYAIEDGQSFGPEEPTWIYDGLPDNLFFSRFVSGVQRLPNGNTMIIQGGGPAARLFEVTQEGEVVWDYTPPFNRAGILLPGSSREDVNVGVFRAKRYPTDYPAFEGRDLSNGQMPEELATTSEMYPAYMPTGEYEYTLSAEQPGRYFTFVTGPAQRIPNDFTIEVLDGNIEPVVTVTNMAGDTIVEASTEISDWVPERPDFYYVTVTHAGDDLSGIEGTFRITRTVDDVFVDLPEDQPIIFYETAIQDEITDEDDSSLFAFYGQAGDVIFVRMQRDNASLIPVVEILDADQQVLSSAGGSPDVPVARIERFEIPEGGLYFLRAARYTGEEFPTDTVGVYSLVIEQVTP